MKVYKSMQLVCGCGQICEPVRMIHPIPIEVRFRCINVDCEDYRVIKIAERNEVQYKLAPTQDKDQT